MKEKLWISVLISAITIAGVYIFIKFNPPLEIGTLAASVDKKTVVIGIGNKGFREVKVLEVSVNNDGKPLKTKIQVSNALQGFIITNDYDNEESIKYGFKNIEDVSIKAGTSLSSNFKKLDDGTAANTDEIYGISILHNEPISEVRITYKYLGISFHETTLFK